MNPLRVSSNLLYLTCIGLTFHITRANLPEANCAGFGYYTPEVFIDGPGMSCQMTAEVYLGSYLNQTEVTPEDCRAMLGPDPTDQIPMQMALSYFQMYCCGEVPLPEFGMCGPNYDASMMCESPSTFNSGALLPYYHCQGDENLPYESCQNEEAGIMAGDAWCQECDDGRGECDVGRLDDDFMPRACLALGGSWQAHTCIEMLMGGMQEGECSSPLQHAGPHCCMYPDMTPAPPRCEMQGPDDDHDDDHEPGQPGGMCAPISEDTVNRMRGLGYEPRFCASAR
jgi:hypothetical protein